ncbi:MAG: DUF3465 domain-containing protein [bacterium]
MKRLLLAAAIVIACLVGVVQWGCSTTALPAGTGADSEATSVNAGDVSLARAFAERAGNLEVEGQGTVSKVLTDDTDGSRHQRFIVRLASGQTLLVTHNIDIAPRVGSLRVGDTVSFKGEYEWNAEGGLIHWTHHDPTGSHAGGWIRHNGRTYQ